MLSYYSTIKEIEESNVDTVILPIGSVEQHGSHLPIGTDYIFIQAVAKEVAEQMNAFLLPTIPFSTCYEHRGKKGSSICTRPNTFYQMLEELVLNLHGQGFKKVILLLGHGGVFIAGPVVRELNSMHDDLQVVLVHPIMNDKVMAVLDCKEELHAGEMETSCMLHLCEDAVKKDLMMQNDYIPDVPREYLNYASLLKLSATGVWGKPSLATKEKGAKLLDVTVKETVKYIEKALEAITVSKW